MAASCIPFRRSAAVHRIAFTKLLMILVGVPLAAAVLCAGILTYQGWSRYGDLVRTSSLLRVAVAAGRVGGIAVPGEAGPTREFITGSGNAATIAAQRRVTDELYSALRAAAAANLVKDPRIDEHLRVMDERMRGIIALRGKVDAKTATLDDNTGSFSPLAVRASELVGTAAAIANDPVLSRRIFGLYATLMFNETTMIQRGAGLLALQKGQLPNNQFVLMVKNIYMNATFVKLFEDFAAPPIARLYQTFDAANGRALQELRELILKNAGTPASEAQIRQWGDFSRELTTI